MAKMLVAKMLRVKVTGSGICSPCRGSREGRKDLPYELVLES